jgi:5-methyltetrahydrofolate--homocysteine methyltransferase
MMGISPADMTNILIQAGASIIGANCGNGIADMIGIVKEIRQTDAAVPIIIHANAGMPQYRDGETTFPDSPADMASRVREITGAGASIIGGCCGTTPDHIKEISRVVRSL